MSDKVTEALQALGLDADDVDPDVLAQLRTAAAKPPKQLDRSDLARLTPSEIVEAEAAGKLDRVLGRQTQGD